MEFKEGIYEIISNRISIKIQDNKRVIVKMQGKKGRIGAWDPCGSTNLAMFYPLGEEPSSICVGKEDIKRVD